MTYKGIAKGKTIELERPLPYRTGRKLSVSVAPLVKRNSRGSPAVVREAMHKPPHLSPGDVDELEKAIEHSKLPVRSEGAFDA
jgi:hypothetical protein